MTQKVPDKDVGQGHQPNGTTWQCGDCGGFWPCEGARDRLAKEFDQDRVVLCLYLASSFTRACGDMPAIPAGILYDRFLGWVR